MPRRVWLDFETYNKEPITSGTYKYAETVEITVMAYAYDNEPAKVIDVTLEGNNVLPVELREALIRCEEIWAHNANFDRVVSNTSSTFKNWPNLPSSKWMDTMVQAYQHSLPGGLDQLCTLFNVPQDFAKIKDGKRLVLLFCKPLGKNRKIRRATRETHPEDWANFLEYARMDVEAMREIYKRMPKVNYPRNLTEVKYWQNAMMLNDRGIALDIDLVNGALLEIIREQSRLKSKIQTNTEGRVYSATEVSKLLSYIKDVYDIDLKDLTKASVLEALLDEDLPDPVRELLEIRQDVGKASTAKYKAMLKSISSDGRVHGILQFRGANRTGRYAGRIIQVQNFPSRGLPDDDVIEQAISATKKGKLPEFTDKVMNFCSYMLRGAIVPGRGKKFVVADWSNIEGRLVAYSATEKWKIKAFRDFDEGKGHDLYNLTYAKSFNKPVEEVTKAERQLGKVLELACLGGDTKVLTDTGVKRIVDVKIEDLLWDGEEWVRHKGLVNRGVREVIILNGIKVTQDHLIKIGRTWRKAHRFASNERLNILSLVTGSASLPSLKWFTRRSVHAPDGIQLLSALAAHHLIKCFTQTYIEVNRLDAISALKSSLITGLRSIMGTRTSFRIPHIDAGCLVEYPPVSTGVVMSPMVDITTTVGVESKSTRNGRRIGRNFWRTLSLLQVGISQILISIGSTLTRVTNLVTCDSSRAPRTAPTSGKYQTCNERSATYDISYSGPRNCFTVISDRGPMIVHNCGYSGGVGAFVTFANGYNVDLDKMADDLDGSLPDDLVYQAENFYEFRLKNDPKEGDYGLSLKTFVACDVLKRLWRLAHPSVVAIWRDLEDSARAAIGDGRGKVYGTFNDLFYFHCEKGMLYLWLPSGRYIVYAGARIGKKGELIYQGQHKITKKWTELSLYSGLILENICQALSAQILDYNVDRLEEMGIPVVMHVHDEIIVEVPKSNSFSIDDLKNVMTSEIPWLKGLPLAAGGFECTRYRK